MSADRHIQPAKRTDAVKTDMQSLQSQKHKWQRSGKDGVSTRMEKNEVERRKAHSHIRCGVLEAIANISKKNHASLQSTTSSVFR